MPPRRPTQDRTGTITPHPRDDHTDTIEGGQVSTESRPALSQALTARLCAYGERESIATGDLLYQPGDDRYDLIVIESGRVDLFCDAVSGASPLRIAEMGPGDFLGELSLFTGERMFITARARDPGTIYRVQAQAFRQLMAEDAELSDVILTALYSRRGLLKTALADTVEIVDHHNSASALALEVFAQRMELPHMRTDAESPRGTAMLRSLDLQPADLPAVLLPDGVLLNASPTRLARRIGLSPSDTVTEPIDLVVIGGGPAGLAATVYGASEGLQTMMLDSVAPGGQAGASSRIENYPGFPHGLSGAELTRRTAIQALKFGAQLYAPYRVVALDRQPDGSIQLTLDDQSHITTRAVIIATGARYKSLPVPRWSEFEGRGIYYAATELEARRCTESPVVVIGGANSAGQAALFLADRCAHVILILRGESIHTHMSAYLVDRVIKHPTITIATHAEVAAVEGTERLESVTVTHQPNRTTTKLACAALFCFIGAVPDTNWLPSVATDKAGFIRTDAQLDHDVGSSWEALRRRPLPFETCVPGVFAAGDVRLGSMKRVAAAMGEGASAVASVHTKLALPEIGS